MGAYQKEKLDNAICYIAKEYKKKTHRNITQIYMYKILARIDFLNVREKGKPVFDIVYKAMKNGPVPKELYENRKTLNTALYKSSPVQETWGEVIYFYSKDNPDLDYFSDSELKLMNDSIFIIASSSIKSKLVSEASHEEIKAWKKAYEKGENSIMNYADEFDDDISNKKEDLLTPQEERFLLWESVKAAKCG